jgi:hypothetical protein
MAEMADRIALLGGREHWWLHTRAGRFQKAYTRGWVVL